MTLCPIALAVGSSKCLAFTICPLKGVAGDFKPEAAAQADKPADKKSLG